MGILWPFNIHFSVNYLKEQAQKLSISTEKKIALESLFIENDFLTDMGVFDNIEDMQICVLLCLIINDIALYLGLADIDDNHYKILLFTKEKIGYYKKL